jgi:diaminopimelate epimerase
VNRLVFSLLFFLSLSSYAINQSEYQSHILNKAIDGNCKGHAHYKLHSGQKVHCLTDKYIQTYGFAKDYKNILNKVIDIASITDRNPHIVFICSDKKECNQSVDKINSFTQKNNLVSVQMSALVIPWL